VWTLTVVLLPVVLQGPPHVVQCAEPACIEALVAQASVEALHVAVLHRSPGLDMDERDLALFSPAACAAR